MELVLEVNTGYNLHLEASADYVNGIRGTKEFLTGRRWDWANGWTTISKNPPAGFIFLTPTWQIETSGKLHAYLQPKLTLYVYSTAGVTGDLQPYADLEGHAQLNPHEWDLALYGGLSSTIGLDLRVWDASWGDLPSQTFDLIPRTLLWETNSTSSPPEITGQPVNQWVSAGGTASFTVQARGPTLLSYRWQKNGLWLSDDSRITGTRGSSLQIANAQLSDAANYRVLVSNTNDTIASQNALLTVYSNNISSGMALIPAGSFTMGNCMFSTNYNDGYADELPLHTVYVSAFYMDKYDVTKALWDSVCLWATNHGYSFDNPGEGAAANHPVQEIDWLDAVKWSNARSEKEGLLPCYYTDATHTSVYRSGWNNLTNACVNWAASGYRLPTEAEWEKAARGGAGGQRFPWADSDTISWGRANYHSYPSGDAYDVNPTSGYDLTFLGTSPVGYFAANGYGLYDMAGNVWQWCWDRYDAGWYWNVGATQTDTRGPDGALTPRVTRGGSCLNGASCARCALRSCYWLYMDDHRFDLGFRCVRRF